MGQRWTIKDMQTLASRFSGRCLSDTYINQDTHLLWECAEGHQWRTMPKHVIAGHWCKKCSGKITAEKIRKYTITDMQDLARKQNGQCLSKKFKSVKIPLLWQCAEGHKWSAPADRIMNQKSWCPVCNGSRQVTIEEMHKIALDRGGKCLSTIYMNNHTPLDWECAEKHRWSSNPANILNGNWCPKCAGIMKLTIEELKAVAESKEGKCLSDEYVNAKAPMLWQCNKGHEWVTNAAHIKQGAWCHICSPSRPLSLEEMQSIAQERGGKCLSTFYTNAHMALSWECADKHKWEATSQMIRQGTWCPECSAGIGERICRAFFQQLFRHPFPKKRPLWLRNNTGHLMELDGYCEELALAFEHQGEQHYSTKHYISSSEVTFINIQERDSMKRQLCLKHGVQLIEIPEVPRLLPLEALKQFIIDECSNKGISLPEGFGKIHVDLKEAYSSNIIKELRTIIEGKGGKCHSATYTGRLHKLKCECREGHFWTPTAAALRSGQWCPTCGSKNVGNKKRSTIEEMRNLATAKGGGCMSTRYTNAFTHLQWKCEKGHVWSAMPLNIRKGGWCPVCVRKQRGLEMRSGIDKMKQIAIARGGRCLSEEYVNARSHLLWECMEGHKWRSVPSSVSRGSWCPKCGRKKK